MVSGRAIWRHLVASGIEAQKVVRKRETGDYIADFYIPNMKDPIEPSTIWASRIRQTLPDARIVETYDTVAGWRPGQPVIHATVVFRLPENIAVA